MIKRSKRRENFTVVNNSIYADNKLSFEAMGLLTYLLSKPDNWRVNVRHLAKVTDETSQKRSEAKIRHLLKELIIYGYVTRKKNGDGSVDYTVYDEPNVENPNVENPNVENPNVENPNVENPNVDFERTYKELKDKQELNNKKERSLNNTSLTPQRGDEGEGKKQPPHYQQKKSKQPKRTNYSAGFEAFWYAYTQAPRGYTARTSGKAKAFEHWRRDALEEIADELVAKVHDFWSRDDGWHRGYQPFAQKWLNERRYDDEPQIPIAYHQDNQQQPRMTAKQAENERRKAEVREWARDTAAQDDSVIDGEYYAS